MKQKGGNGFGQETQRVGKFNPKLSQLPDKNTTTNQWRKYATKTTTKSNF